MIRVNKGKAPVEASAKCQELTDRLTRIYAELNVIYGEKKTKKQKVDLTDADYDRLAVQADPTVTKQVGTASVRRQLPTFVFGEEIVESLDTKAPPTTDSELDSLLPTWRKRYQSLLDQYVGIRKRAEVEWNSQLATKFTILGKDVREQIEKVIPGIYGRHALRAGQPFFDAAQSRRPHWFTVADLGLWRDDLGLDKQPPADLAAAWYAWYQISVDNVLRTLAKTPGLAPLTWMIADVKAGPAEQKIFAFAKVLHFERLAKKRRVDTGMTAEELASLRTSWTDQQIVFAFLSILALSEAMYPDVEPKKVMTVRPLLGFRSDTFDSAFYSGHGIKEALMTSHFGKCVFCESKVRAIAHGDVEHFRPKAGYDQGHTFNHDGYFWRAYAWENLYFSCQVCNQVYKNNDFPLLPDDTPALTLTRKTFDRDDRKERPVLIDPGFEDPRDFIRFDPRTGRAYPWDVLRAYLAKNPVGQLGAEAAVWADPNLIPDLSTVLPSGLADGVKKDAISYLAGDWTQFYRDPTGTYARGTRTIGMLGLNRPELVTRRVQQLRALRGLFLAAKDSSGDQAGAKLALAEAVAPGAEFSSLAIDALATWEAGKASFPWLLTYHAVLAAPPVYEYVEGGLEDKDIPIMYFIPKLDRASKVRELVYLNQKEAIDDDDQADGWYLHVPEDDYNLDVTVSRGKKVENLKVADLFAPGLQAWRKFKGSKVTVTGPFSTDVSGLS